MRSEYLISFRHISTKSYARYRTFKRLNLKHWLRFTFLKLEATDLSRIVTNNKFLFICFP